jgi:hypothetical protein
MNVFNSLPKAAQTNLNCSPEDLKKLNFGRTFSQESSQLSTQDEFEMMPVESEQQDTFLLWKKQQWRNKNEGNFELKLCSISF